jgi:hypothetical protein
LPLHFQTNSVLCGFRLHLEDSEAPLQGCMFFGRGMTRQIAVPIEYTYTYVLYIQYIYIGNMLHMLHHHAHLPSLCSISSFEILKPWFEHVYSLKIYQWQSTYAYMYIYI